MNNANASRHRAVGNVLDETGRRERQQAQRIAELEARVTRLQNALREMDADYSREVDDETYDDAMMEGALLSLQWGDMDPVEGNDDGQD